jgi:putative ABC transport system permease protein
MLDLIHQALTSLARNRVRSVLAILGIAMGVASFICVVAMGQAGTQKVQEQLENVGDNMIWVEAGARARNGVRTGARSTKSLIEADSKAIVDQIPLIKSAAPNVDGRVQLVYGNNNWNTTFRGVSPEFLEIRKWAVESGNSFTQSELDHSSTVCVLGRTVADNLFGGENPVGKIIRMNDVPCNVIGVLKARGASTTGQDQDDFFLLPLSTAQKRIAGQTWLDDIYFSTVSREAIPEATKQITALLRERHHLRPNEDDDFNIRSPEDFIRMQLQASEVFALLLGAIASISLVVGGIGIMNIMLVSITQRTKEIGVRLAVGATEEHVQLQFLSEAVFLSLCGGLLGLGIGVVATYVLQQEFHWEMQLSSGTLLVAALFSMGVGLLFGFYPARRASQLDPIKALRFE